jgi:hypothetical protein
MILIVFFLHVVDVFVNESFQVVTIIGGPQAGDKGGVFR